MPIESVIKCLPTLKDLAQAKTKKQQNKLLSKAKSCIYYSISEISKNILNGNISIDNHHKKKLEPYRNQLRVLSRKSIPLKKRKEIIIQTGGAFLPALLWPAISFLSAKLSDQFAK